MPLPPRTSVLRLETDELAVELLPDNGADIVGLIDRRTAINLLWRTPWGWRDPGQLPPMADSQADWLARYPGGWQQLLPNAGPARQQDGLMLGYHGEAAIVPWTVQELTTASAVLTVDLMTAPLRMRREVTLSGSTVTLRDTVTNLSPDPVQVRWVQHPGFGEPFIDQAARIDAGARTLLTDPEIPGTNLPSDAALTFPVAIGLDQREVDLRVVPGPHRPHAVFGALTDFEATWFTITSPNTGLGLKLEWDQGLFPHAWFWQECHSTRGFPWYRRAYVVAIEPANTLPGDGQTGRYLRGDAPWLLGNACWVSDLTATLFAVPGPVAT